MTVDLEKLAALREPFPPSQIGVLPQPYKKDSPKGTCEVCHKWHGLPAMHLDFVGHGAITDRLLTIDPEWTWQPYALDAAGLPALDREGNLWILLTIGGLTRIGVGDGPTMKVRIGDALRNAGMRFGMALDLWIRGDGEDDKKETADTAPPEGDETVPGLRSSIEAAIAKLDDDAREALKGWFAENDLGPVRRLNATQCERVIDHLMDAGEQAT